MPIQRLTVSLVARNEPFRGPSSSGRINDEVQEILTDVSSITKQWNGNLFPLLDPLPKGSGVSDPRFPNAKNMPNPYEQGLDGSTLFLDVNAKSNTDSGRFWNTLNNRPVTAKELHLQVVEELRVLEENLLEQINEFSDVLTDEQKARIGENIFDPTKISSDVSLDGRSSINALNVAQLGKDLYGPSPLLDGDGQGNLKQVITNNNISVRQIVNAILNLHGGSWTADTGIDNTVLHSLVDADISVGAAIDQTKIDKSSTIDDSFSGATANLLDDLNKIRTFIKKHAGASAWDTDLAPTYVSGPTNLKDHMDEIGTGIPDANNPHGLDISDLDDTSGLLLASNEASEISYVPNGSRVINGASTDLQSAVDDLDLGTFNHIQDTSNPHNVSAAQISGTAIISELNAGSTVGLLSGTRLRVDDNAVFLIEHNTDGTHAGAIALTDLDIPTSITRDSEVESIVNPIIDAKIAAAVNLSNRFDIPIINHFDSSQPIRITHNQGKYPIVQVLDTSLDATYPYDNAGLVDEAYGQLGAYIGESDEFVSIQHINTNEFHVYTSVVKGVIIALF